MPRSIYDTPFDTSIFIGKHYRDVLPEILAEKLEAAAELVTCSLSTEQIDYELEIDGVVRFYSACISPMIGGDYTFSVQQSPSGRDGSHARKPTRTAPVRTGNHPTTGRRAFP